MNNQDDTEDENPLTNLKDEPKIEIKKPHKFIYPRLNFFGAGLSSSVGDSCSNATPTAVANSCSAVASAASTNNSCSASSLGMNSCSDQQLTQLKLCCDSKQDSSSNPNCDKKSPFTFFSMDSEDDFDPYGSDVPSDIDTKRDLLGHGLENQNVDIESGSCYSACSSTVSTPVCRICQLPGVEPSNPLISPCRCLGSIRYVHNNCLLVSFVLIFYMYRVSQ